MFHQPVLLKEVLEYLAPKPNQNFIDLTLGGGGHTMALLERTAPEGKILALDLDKSALDRFNLQFTIYNFQNRIVLVNGNFRDLKKIVEKYQFSKIAGIIGDLGFSSLQIEDAERGFSFQTEGPLDMRFGQNSSLTAYEIVNSWPRNEIAEILEEYGEERSARKISEAIFRSRKLEKIETTRALARIVADTVPFRRGIHPATKTFQALRIAVNQELENLKEMLPQAIDVLEKGGRLAIISFHSLEDRIVKQFFKSQKNQSLKIITKKPVRPSGEEMNLNPRSRSAKLRVAEKIIM